MPFVMTKETDVVDVQVEIDGEVAFTLKVGVIPNEIGDRIAELMTKNIDLVKAQVADDQEAVAAALVDSVESINETTKLYIKYGVKGLEGPEYADGSPVRCTIIKEPKTGFDILDEETMRMFLNNKTLLSLATANVADITRIGVGIFKKEGYKTTDEAKAAQVPLAPSLAQSSKG